MLQQSQSEVRLTIANVELFIISADHSIIVVHRDVGSRSPGDIVQEVTVWSTEPLLKTMLQWQILRLVTKMPLTNQLGFVSLTKL